MSTNCFISGTHSNGNQITIYCHYDGYPEWTLEKLRKFYNTQEKVDALLELGNLSCIGDYFSRDLIPEDTVGSNDPNRQWHNTSWTEAYHRDRGEPLNFVKKDGTTREQYYNCSYRYKWDGSQWLKIRKH